MRTVFLMLVPLLLAAVGCATTPPPAQPVVWAPSSPERALVVFVDDHSIKSLSRTDDFVLQVQQFSLAALERYQYEVVEGERLTQDFLDHSGRRAGSELVDSLPMLNGWGFALAQTFFLHSESNGQYRKIWISVDNVLYDVVKNRTIKKWQDRMPRHIVVAQDCERSCVQASLSEKMESLMASVAKRTDGYLRNYGKPVAPSPAPAPKPDPKPPTSPEPEPEPEPKVPGEKGQWNTINF